MAKRKIGILSAFIGRLKLLENPFRSIPMDALWKFRGELTKMLGHNLDERARLNTLNTLVLEAMRHKAHEAQGTLELVISDHAFARYVERHTDIDIQTIKDDILSMVEAGAPEAVVKEGVVVTILPKGVTSVEASLLMASESPECVEAMEELVAGARAAAGVGATEQGEDRAGDR